jgi:peptidoglycan/LPS O-acetylase OafA/YrhL
MKAHYEVLDGLRGTAALAIVVFHIFEMTSADLEHNPMHHTFLAADFFFALSGFVIGYAYDERMRRGAPAKIALSFWQFAKRRLVRLHPVVIVGMIAGLAGYLVDPFVGDKQTVGVAISFGQLALIFGLSLFLLPAPSLPNEFGETHGINGPAWTLFQEYIANVLYGLFAHKMNRAVHIVLCLASAGALVWVANHFGDLGHGWSWKEFWVAPVRMACPFLIGLLVFRMGLKVTIPQPFVLLSIVLVVLLMLPLMGAWNALFESACVIVIFPLILMAGAGTTVVSGWVGRLCRFTGKLSYPVYIIHYPCIYIFGHWVWSTHPDQATLWPVMVGLYAFEVMLGVVLLYAYDLPVRAWLTKKFIERKQDATARTPVSV